MKIGLVQMPFGIASMIGSVVGGKLCDRALGKSSEHEARIRAIIWAVVPLVLALAAYGWLAQLGMHVASLVVSLFVVGAFLM
jgi:MFS family permease